MDPRTLPPQSNSGVSIPREQLRSLFDIFDVEHTGKIDARELKAALRALGVPVKVEQLQSMMASMGRSLTESITFQDFLMITEANLPARDSDETLKQTFVLFGGDESGYITIEHLKQACEELNENIPEVELRQMIHEADRDGDGRVTFADFVRIMRQHYDILADEDD